MNGGDGFGVLVWSLTFCALLVLFRILIGAIG